MKVSLEITADGSPTLYRGDMNEHYHSVKGAIAESNHVYIDCGWRQAAAAASTVRAFEVGLGTGLNAVLTAQAALDEGVDTKYYTVELYPLSIESVEAYAAALPTELRDTLLAIHGAPWGQPVEINPYFTLIKLNDNLLTMELPTGIDVTYYDAFAPEKQPEMWSEAIFRKLYNAMNPGAILTTYCTKGAIRRMLNTVGFLTERLPGPPGGKREILRATHPANQP
ncbi:MAG: tRNA (5-methylaminomethyl-2-thiouridine)(34)-methyltransferase MnmD [Bacteroidales bacterium]|nr:tRNA (5-methylaminomethyl-2-thiouridine)(34)-methyltransferase MnmD [Bacteroidales bacterium]